MTKKTGRKDARIKHGMEGTRFYRIWGSMIQRVRNPKRKVYYLYGGRGIVVCEKWKNFKGFYEDMFDSYSKHIDSFGERQTTLDRVDNNGNYEQSNCRWATLQEQRRNNSRKVKLYEYRGVKLCLKDWHKLTGISLTKLWDNVVGNNRKNPKTLKQILDEFFQFRFGGGEFPEKELRECFGQFIHCGCYKAQHFEDALDRFRSLWRGGDEG